MLFDECTHAGTINNVDETDHRIILRVSLDFDIESRRKSLDTEGVLFGVIGQNFQTSPFLLPAAVGVSCV